MVLVPLFGQEIRDEMKKLRGTLTVEQKKQLALKRRGKVIPRNKPNK